MDDLWFYIQCVCTCWCMWVKKEYVKSALKRHLYTQFFYFFGKLFILKMIHNPFKVSVQCNHITEIITTTDHSLLGRLCYTPCLLNNSFPHCLLEKLWGLYEPSAVTLWISLGTHIPYRCYKKCHWTHRWNFQMHQIYTGKHFTGEVFLRNRYHVRHRNCWWHVVRKNRTKFVLDWRHLQGNHWTHLHNKECDCIIIITNKIKLMCLHQYKTTVVYKLWRLLAKLNFVNWYLQRVHAGEVN